MFLCPLQHSLQGDHSSIRGHFSFRAPLLLPTSPSIMQSICVEPRFTAYVLLYSRNTPSGQTLHSFTIHLPPPQPSSYPRSQPLWSIWTPPPPPPPNLGAWRLKSQFPSISAVQIKASAFCLWALESPSSHLGCFSAGGSEGRGGASASFSTVNPQPQIHQDPLSGSLINLIN